MPSASTLRLLTVGTAGQVRIHGGVEGTTETVELVVLSDHAPVLDPDTRDAKRVVCRSKVLPGASVTLDPHLPVGAFTAVLFAYDAAEDAHLSIACEGSDVAVTEPPTVPTVSKTLTMIGHGAGGYGCVRGPQFFVTIGDAGDVALTLTVTNPSAADATALWVQRVSGESATAATGTPGTVSWGNAGARLLTTPLTAGAEARGWLPDATPGVYAVLAMKSRPTPCAVTLTVTSAVVDAAVSIDGFAESLPQLTERGDVGQPVEAAEAAELVPGLATTAYCAADDARDTLAAAAALDADSEAWVDASDAAPKWPSEEATEIRAAQLTKHARVFTSGETVDALPTAAAGVATTAAALQVLHDRRPALVNAALSPVSFHGVAGAFAASLCFSDGVRRSVLFDDRLPCDAATGAVLSTCGRDWTAAWLPLLVKAMAKAANGYDKLSALGSGAAGAAAATRAVAGGEVCDLAVTAESMRALATTVKSKLEYVAAFSPDMDAPDASACTIVAAVEASGCQLLRVRPHWGSYRWTGDWAPTSQAWAKHPTAARACGVDIDEPAKGLGDDWWMPLDAFVAKYGSTAVHWREPAEDGEDATAAVQLPHHADLESRWLEDKAGTRAAGSLHRNRQLHVVADEPGVTLQLVLRRNSANQAPRLGFVCVLPPDASGTSPAAAEGQVAVVGSSGEYSDEIVAPHATFFESPFVGGTLSVAATVTLPPGVQRLVVVPLSELVPAPLHLAVRGSCPVRVVDSEPLKGERVSHGWRDGGAKYESPENPRVKITLKAASPLFFEAALEEHLPRFGCYMALTRGPPADSWPTDVVARTKFTVARQQRMLTPTLEAGVYTLWLTLGKVAEGAVVVSCAAKANVRLDPM